MAPPRRRSRSGGTSRGYERTDRLGELLREIVAEELDRIDDERLELVTVTAVDVDRELERARVYYTVLGGDERRPDILEALAEHRGRVRRAIGNQARVRRVPDVMFTPDEAQRSAERIEDILRSIHDDDDTARDDTARDEDGDEHRDGSQS
jgi:ribosome-binding factor A